MRWTTALFLGPIMASTLTACQSKQHQSAGLQAEYDAAYKRYYADCIAPVNSGTGSYFKDTKPKTATPQQLQEQHQKCAIEGARVDKLQEEMAAIVGK